MLQSTGHFNVHYVQTSFVKQNSICKLWLRLLSYVLFDKCDVFLQFMMCFIL